MIVVIILTAIVVGLAFSVLSLVQKHMSSIQHNFNQSTVLNTFETALWIDFNRYSEIRFDDLENELILKNEMDSIAYKFLEKIIIRDFDTISIPLQSKLFYFNGNLIENGTVDAIKLETSKESQHQKLFIFKQNDASVYMK